MMKKILLSFTAGLFCVAISAQTNQTNLDAAEVVAETLDQTETITEVYGIMVCRLTEEASSTYTTGSAEISYEDLIERIEASTTEINVDGQDGEEITVVLGPSVTRLDDNHGSAPPALNANESALDYLQRLEEMVANDTQFDDFLVIATTGGEFGISYTRVQASEANSINDVSDSSLNLNLYPNPTTDQISVAGLPTGNHPAQIIDAQGKTVLEVNVTNNEQIDFSQLASGFYTLKVLVDDKVQLEKFQIKK